MSNYSRGANFERRCKAYLVQQGWMVFRSAGSHSPADLIAMRGGEFILIQAKINGKLSFKERAYLWLVAEENNCQAMLAYRQGRKLILEEIKEGNKGREI